MSTNTKIEWSDATWTPIRARVKDNAAEIASAKGYGSLIQIAAKMAGHVGPHCEHASPGCANCYSETNNGRCLPVNGTGLPFDRRARDLVDIFLDEDLITQPLHWKKPRKIFVCSQTDLFGEFVADEMIDRVFAVMSRCPQHTFQVLTKRAKRMREWVSNYQGTQDCPSSIEFRKTRGTYFRLPLLNVWLGVSVENQQYADERIPHLLQTPAAMRWVSYEPALGPVDFERIPLPGKGVGEEWDPIIHMNVLSRASVFAPHVHWVIVGGESGPDARPFDVRWARSVVRQCRAAGVACFVKQLGAYPVIEPCRQHHYDFGGAIGRKARFSAIEPMRPSTGMWRVHFSDRKGGDMEEWPEDLRVREMPFAVHRLAAWRGTKVREGE